MEKQAARSSRETDTGSESTTEKRDSLAEQSDSEESSIRRVSSVSETALRRSANETGGTGTDSRPQYVDYSTGPDQQTVAEEYGIEIHRRDQATRIRRLESEFGGQQVGRWADEGMPVETMGKKQDMEAFRTRQERRPDEVPADIERRNRASLHRNRDADHDDGPAGSPGVPEAVRTVIASPGTSVDETVQREMESKIGGDFSDVQLHTGPAAVAAAESINARAFTVGNHIAFNEGEYDPGSRDGKRLLAHELTHVRQQTDGKVSLLPKEGPARHDGALAVAEGVVLQPKLEVSSPDDPAEREAEQVAKAVVDADRNERDVRPEDREPSTEALSSKTVTRAAGATQDGGASDGTTTAINTALNQELGELQSCKQELNKLYPSGGGGTKGWILELENAITGTANQRPSYRKVKEKTNLVEEAAGRAVNYWTKGSKYDDQARKHAEQGGTVLRGQSRGEEKKGYMETIRKVDRKREEIKETVNVVIDHYLSATEPTEVYGQPLSEAASNISSSKDITNPTPEKLEKHIKIRKPEVFSLMDALTQVATARQNEVLANEGVEAATQAYRIINSFETNRFLYLQTLLEQDFILHSPDLVFGQGLYAGEDPLGQLYVALEWVSSGDTQSKVEREKAKTEAKATGQGAQKQVLETLGTIQSLRSEALIQGAGQTLEAVVPQAGDKATVMFQMEIPTGQGWNIVFGMTASMLRKGKETYKSTFETNLGASVEADAYFLELKAAIEGVGRIMSQDDSGPEVMRTFIMGFLNGLQMVGIPEKLLDPLVGTTSLEEVKTKMDEDDYADLSFGARFRASASADATHPGSGHEMEAKASGQATTRAGQKIEGTEGEAVETKGYTETSFQGTVSFGGSVAEGVSPEGSGTVQYKQVQYEEDDWTSLLKLSGEFTVSDLKNAGKWTRAGVDHMLGKIRTVLDAYNKQIDSVPEGVAGGLSGVSEPAVKAGMDDKLQALDESLTGDQSAGRDVGIRVSSVMKWGPDGLKTWYIAFYTVESVSIDLETFEASFSKRDRLLKIPLGE